MTGDDQCRRMTTTAFLTALYLARANYCLRCPAITVEAAAEEANKLGATFRKGDS